jgi:hypothetical protein
VFDSVFPDTGVEVSLEGGVGCTTVVVSATGAVTVSDGVFTTVGLSEGEGLGVGLGAVAVSDGVGVGSGAGVGVGFIPL